MEVDYEALNSMLLELCPTASVNMPPNEKASLLKYLAQGMQYTREIEQRLSQLQRAHTKDRDITVRARDILLRIASFIPDEAAQLTDEEEVQVPLPGLLARPLCLMGQEVTIAETVRVLSAKRAVRGIAGFCYPNNVSAHRFSPSGKALEIEDLKTQEVFWVPTSQIVTKESQVYAPGDVGVLVVSEWFAQQKEWVV